MHFDLYTPVGLNAYYFFYPGFMMLLFGWIDLIMFKKTIKRMNKFYLSIVQGFSLKVNNDSFENIKFSKILISIFFLFFVFNKLWNLVPLKISISSKMMFTFLFAFLIWITFNSSSVFFNLFSYFSHYTTPGSPLLLIPFMKMIEVISNIIRPLTLGVRLAVNLLTGHLLLTMFTNAHCSLLMKVNFYFIFLFFFGLFVFFYEFCVCIIQALVYNLMLSQYFDEHSS